VSVVREPRERKEGERGKKDEEGAGDRRDTTICDFGRIGANSILGQRSIRERAY